MPAPKVLISDALSDAAVQRLRDRGLDVDFRPELGRDRDACAALIGAYDGLAIRSTTKVTAKLLAQRPAPEGGRPRRNRRSTTSTWRRPPPAASS